MGCKGSEPAILSAMKTDTSAGTDQAKREMDRWADKLYPPRSPGAIATGAAMSEATHGPLVAAMTRRHMALCICPIENECEPHKQGDSIRPELCSQHGHRPAFEIPPPKANVREITPLEYLESELVACIRKATELSVDTYGGKLDDSDRQNWAMVAVLLSEVLANVRELLQD